MSGWAAAASAAGDILNTGLSFYGARQLAKYQAKLNYKYAQKSTENSPTWNRAGLEKAGYNPMLAVQNSTSGANSSWTSSPSFSSGSDFSNATSAYLDSKRLANETESTKSSVAANEATARNQNAEAASRELQNPYVADKIKTEIAQNQSATSKLNSDTEVNKATVENMQSRLELDREIQAWQRQAAFMGLDVQRQGNAINAYNASTNRYNAETSRIVGNSTSWRNYNASLGYTSSGHGLGFGFSHTGNPNGYTKFKNSHSHYEYEYINGKKVRVKVYD